MPNLIIIILFKRNYTVGTIGTVIIYRWFRNKLAIYEIDTFFMKPAGWLR